MPRKRHLQLCLAFYTSRKHSTPKIIAPTAALVAALVQRCQQLSRRRRPIAQAEMQTAGHLYYASPRVDLGDSQPVPPTRLQQLLSAAVADWVPQTEEQAAWSDARQRYHLATWYLVGEQFRRTTAWAD